MRERKGDDSAETRLLMKHFYARRWVVECILKRLYIFFFSKYTHCKLCWSGGIFWREPKDSTSQCRRPPWNLGVDFQYWWLRNIGHRGSWTEVPEAALLLARSALGSPPYRAPWIASWQCLFCAPEPYERKYGINKFPPRILTSRKSTEYPCSIQK